MTEEDWITRSLRAMHAGEPGYDPEEAKRKFREGVERMERDPEYAAYIRQLADEADMDFAALDQAEETTVQLTSPEVPEIDPRVREAFDETIAEHPYPGQGDREGLDEDALPVHRPGWRHLLLAERPARCTG
jgi:hypothetical protein